MMKDEDSSKQSHFRMEGEENSQKNRWECIKCGYVGRARTRLERGLKSIDWASFLSLILVAFGILFVQETLAYVISILLMIVSGIVFSRAQFRPSRPYNICPQCRAKSKAPKTEYVPLIPPRKKPKKRKGQKPNRPKIN